MKLKGDNGMWVRGGLWTAVVVWGLVGCGSKVVAAQQVEEQEAKEKLWEVEVASELGGLPRGVGAFVPLGFGVGGRLGAGRRLGRTWVVGVQGSYTGGRTEAVQACRLGDEVEEAYRDCSTRRVQSAVGGALGVGRKFGSGGRLGGEVRWAVGVSRWWQRDAVGHRQGVWANQEVWLFFHQIEVEGAYELVEKRWWVIGSMGAMPQVDWRAEGVSVYPMAELGTEMRLSVGRYEWKPFVMVGGVLAGEEELMSVSVGVSFPP